MRRGLFWVGLAATVAGVLVLGYVGWEFVGTDIVARQRQQQLVEALQDDWEAGSASTQETTVAEPGEASALLRIPRFGDSYVMPVLEGTTEAVLARGFGHVDAPTCSPTCSTPIPTT